MADATPPQEDTSVVPSIRMVIQRYRFASVLIEEKGVVSVGQQCSSLVASSNDDNESLGLLAYISFSLTATKEKVVQAANTLLNMPVGTLGAWGDGSRAQSMLQLLSSSAAAPSDDKPKSLSPLSIILVPQANLIAKIKKNGKSIQYRDQIAKEKGKELYDLFCDTVQVLLMDHEALCRGEKSMNPKSNNKKSANVSDPSIPPDQLFRQRSSDFATFDDATGLPLTTISGDPVSKSARKRMQKQYDVHVKRHEKYQEKQKASPTQPPNKVSPTTKDDEGEEAPTKTLDLSFLQLIKGTFGRRQGLELQSDMGPFCHVVEI